MEGAAMMIENGILENPHVDAALAIHVFTAMAQPVGSVLAYGPRHKFASVDWFTIKITGKGCHGALPNTGVDPLNVMSHIHIALQAINSREMDQGEPMVLTIGQMHGGQTSNVIPQEAFMTGTIRAVSNEGRAFIKERMEAIVSTIASAFRAEAHVEYGAGCPVLEFNADVYAQTAEYCKADGDLPYVDLGNSGGPAVTMGSEDFAYVLGQVPGTFLGIAAGHPDDGRIYPQHHPKAIFEEDALPSGSAAYAQVAIEWLKNNK